MAVPAAFTAIWNHTVVRFARSVSRDLAKMAIILFGLQVFWWMLRRMEFYGYPQGQLDYLEKLHFCLSVSAMVIFGVVFLGKLMADLYREK